MPVKAASASRLFLGSVKLKVVNVAAAMAA